jgi:hypothetical protein
MNTFEIITLIFSFIALSLSIISLIFSHKNSKKQIELEKTQANLAKKQLQQIKEEEESRNKAYLQISLEGYSGNSNLYIRNVSHVPAIDIDIKIYPREGKHSPIIDTDYKSKFPLKRLDPGDEIYLMFPIDSGTGYNFDSRCTWKNPDNSDGIKETFLSW